MLGEVFETKNYGKCKVVEYVDSMNVQIRFIATGFTAWHQADPIRRGKVKDYYHPIVHGVGFLGVGDYAPRTHRELYRKWAHMIGRCYDPKYQEKRPTYIGCTVVKRWRNFQNFCADIVQMKNWDTPGFDLDKDLRVLGNKKYGPRYCSFVPAVINSAFSFKSTRVSKYGVGVAKSGNGFLSQLSTIDGHMHGKYVATAAEAQRDYVEMKRAYLRRLAKKYKKQIHSEVYDTLLAWH